MFDEPISTIIFKFINFGALIGLFVYIYVRFFKDEIKKDIEQEHLDKIALDEQIIQLNMQSKELLTRIIDQENLCKNLLERTEQWKEAAEINMQRAQEDAHVLHKKTIERARRQSENLQQQKFLEEILPHAVHKVQESLVVQFTRPSEGKYFVSDILTYMKKST